MNKKWAHLSIRMMKKWAIQVENGFKMTKNWAGLSFKIMKPCTLYNLHRTCLLFLNDRDKNTKSSMEIVQCTFSK